MSFTPFPKLVLNGSPAYGFPLPKTAATPINAPLPAGVQNDTVSRVQDQQLIQAALQILGQTRHLPADEDYLRSNLGIVPPFQNGQQALQTILSKGINVTFADFGTTKAHAQWVSDQRTILLNERYRGDFSRANLYALAEALYHETGHALGNGDDISSIQEELSCLALNALAYRSHCAVDPYYGQAANASTLQSDGVALYARLFFDSDPLKRGLINRVVEKYGELPVSSPGYPVFSAWGSVMPLAYRVKQQAQLQRRVW